MRRVLMLAAAAAAVALAGCAAKPRTPDWELNAHGALQRYVAAYMGGQARVEAAEFERARTELAATGQAGLLARAELTRCALRVASLVMEPCDGFERLRADAPAAERAYADFLAGRTAPSEVALLPPQYRAVASGQEETGAVKAIDDPLSRLVAAGVLARNGRANGEVLALAAETASQQGWRRPLLAWLGVQARRADAAGASDEAERLRRRIAIVAGQR